MNETRADMIKEARLAGGMPVIGAESLEECFTYEPVLGALILWFNVGATTRAVVRHVLLPA